MWGAGPEVHEQAISALKLILKEQGVNSDHLQTRSQQAIKAIGAEGVITACNSKAPWRNLKATGNNVKFQFILPQELQDKIAQKAGHEVARKPAGPKKAAKAQQHEEQIQLDPAKLILPEGTFH